MTNLAFSGPTIGMIASLMADPSRIHGDVRQTLFGRLLDGKTRLRIAPEHDHAWNTLACEGEKLGGIVAGALIELLDQRLDAGGLQSRERLRQVGLRERVGPGQDADFLGARHGAERAIDELLATDRDVGALTVKHILGKRLADDRGRTEQIVGRHAGGADIIRGRSGAGAARRQDEHEDLVLLDQLLGRRNAFGRRKRMLEDEFELASVNAARGIDLADRQFHSVARRAAHESSRARERA